MFKPRTELWFGTCSLWSQAPGVQILLFSVRTKQRQHNRTPLDSEMESEITHRITSDQTILMALYTILVWINHISSWIYANEPRVLDNVLLLPVASFLCHRCRYEPPNDKTKWPVRPAKAQISLRYPPILTRVFAVRMKKPWVLSYLLSAQRRLIKLVGCPGWSVFAVCTGHFVTFVLWQLILSF